MTGPSDPFARDDAAYVLGVLPDDEREAFEHHLLGCAQCRARVDELRGMPALLGTITVDDLDSVTAVGDERLPDTLLPSLLRAASARRRRGRAVVGALAAIAAACIAALVIVVWPSSSPSSTAPSSSRPPTLAAQNFVSLVKAPVSANAVLTAKKWGTEIDLKCVYSGNLGEKPVPYLMYAYDSAGHPYGAGSWKQGAEVTYVGGTSLDLDKIAKIEITLKNGTPILRLTKS